MCQHRETNHALQADPADLMQTVARNACKEHHGTHHFFGPYRRRYQP
jgi:hypothetical protein